MIKYKYCIVGKSSTKFFKDALEMFDWMSRNKIDELDRNTIIYTLDTCMYEITEKENILLKHRGGRTIIQRFSKDGTFRSHESLKDSEVKDSTFKNLMNELEKVKEN